VRDRRFHDLRHTYGTRMASAGVEMQAIQAYMGHASIKTTQQYAKWSPSGTQDMDNHERAFCPRLITAPTALLNEKRPGSRSVSR
jgi:integrase